MGAGPSTPTGYDAMSRSTATEKRRLPSWATEMGDDMGFLDKLLTGGAVVLVGALARTAFRDAQETQRRKNSPLCFDDGLTQNEFIEIARDVAKRTPRVGDVVITGMTVSLYVRSNSGLTTWTAEVDFNDYGHLTGAYWLGTENSDSLIPEHFANAVQAQIRRRVSRTATER